ncbi:hypothetical protein [Cellulomonas sp. S1-8]|uniref:hypothetical protein n=1 Tax=Cellulomonas sp. S1-8 TaxID=2904790 RepID=UPI002243311D|nr:hypothetical protein [Cellulomonas sp. S1-8]UZN03793.1 hypothetical protein OKX07_02295 [Cellulomonas sp. S1-8]
MTPVSTAERELGLTHQGSRNLIKTAEAKGWLHSLGTHGRGGREHWYAPEVLAIMEAPMMYDAAP